MAVVRCPGCHGLVAKVETLSPGYTVLVELSSCQTRESTLSEGDELEYDKVYRPSWSQRPAHLTHKLHKCSTKTSKKAEASEAFREKARAMLGGTKERESDSGGADES